MKKPTDSLRFFVNTVLVIFTVAFAIMFVAQSAVAGTTKELKDYLTNLPFTMPAMKEPSFPEKTFSIAAYGAVADGRTLNSKAFSDAIKACVDAGGGTVLVPSGTWLTGSIRLESNVNLHLERGALVQFSSRLEDFPLVKGFDGKSKRYQTSPPLFAYNAKNIAITGEGMFDGAGEVWRPVKKEKQTAGEWKKLLASGGGLTEDGKIWWPSKEGAAGEQYLKDLLKSTSTPTEADVAKAREFLRPNLVELVQCDGILLDGPTFRNSPRFHVHPNQCENLIVRNVTIGTQWWAQNGDGLDLSTCRNVVVYNTTVDAGDDGICVKPGKIGSPCENIVIADCIVYHGHGGFVIGSESKGGAQNILVRNCIFNGTDVGLRFKSGRDRGGLIHNVYIDGIQMRDITTEAILFDMYYGDNEASADDTVKEAEEKPVTELTPRFRDFFISNVVCTGADRAILVNGLPEMFVSNIHIENVHLAARKGVLCGYADSIFVKDADITLKSGPVISVNQSTNLFFSGINAPQDAELYLQVNGSKTANIQVDAAALTHAKKGIEYGKSAKQDAVVKK